MEEFVLRGADLAAGEIGTGLTAAGELSAGGTYTVLAGELAAAAGLAEFGGNWWSSINQRPGQRGAGDCTRLAA